MKQRVLLQDVLGSNVKRNLIKNKDLGEGFTDVLFVVLYLVNKTRIDVQDTIEKI
jgi:NTP pyrophosphatase (non-canonical NTP hydrolase)